MLKGTIKLSHPFARKVKETCFPGYKGRKPVRVYTAKQVHIADYWDSGSRDYAVILDLNMWTTKSSDDIPKEVRIMAANPFNLPIADVELTPGMAVVEHSIFCGKDVGLRISMREEDLGKIGELDK